MNSNLSFFSVAGSFLAIVIEEMREDLRDYPIDTTPAFSVASYFIGMTYFGAPLWKALIVSSIVLLAMKCHFGRRRIAQLAIAVLIFTLAVWVEAIPSPAQWRALVGSIADQGRIL
jgi:hypothetical protein